ncbi:acyltransferase [Candidatus Pelagibacter ubique]|nr:acyltransferase [Candidatus Pelagibacter ubique]
MNRISSVELLRFISSFMILIWHYQHFFYPYNKFSSINIFDDIKVQPLFNNLSIFYEYGDLGVQIFFTISGFVFSYIYLQRSDEPLLKEFAVNRFARLYPLHFVTLIVVLLAQIYSMNKFGNYQIYSVNDTYHFILNLFFISGWGFEKTSSFNGPIWSVSIELIIYVFFIINIRRNKFYHIFIIFITFLILRKANILDQINLLNFNLIIDCGTLFYSGVLINFFIDKYKNNKIHLIAGIFLIFLSFIGNFKTFLFCPGLLLLFLSFEKYINSYLKKIFNILGNLTYGMYLCHFPLQIICIMLIYNFDIDAKIYLNVKFLLSYLILVSFVALISFIFFEKKFNILIRKKLLK